MKKLLIAIVTVGVLSLAGAAFAMPEIVAHRGASEAAPENTLAAAKLAWKVAADAVEIDVYLTKDNRIVVLHDPTTTRTTGVNMKVQEHTLDELRSLDAGKWKGQQWAGEKIPTLEEVLATVPRHKRIFMEIKCGVEVIPKFLEVLKGSRKRDRQVAVISFSKDVVKAVKQARPSLQVYWLCAPRAGNADELVSTTRALGVDGIDAQATDSFNAEFAAKVRAAKMHLYAWTVDDAEAAKKLTALGVDGITTNRPEQIKALLAGK